MRDNGIEVWVITATSEPVVRAFSASVGLPTDRVVGVRMVLDPSGKQTYNLQGCGDVPDGQNNGAAIFEGNSCLLYTSRCV